MGRRFSRIEAAARLEQARIALAAYKAAAATRVPKVGQGTPREFDATCYIQPFTVKVGATEVIDVKAFNKGYTTLAPIIAGSTVADVVNTLGTKTLISIPKFRAARVVWFRNASRIATAKPSTFTGQPYLKYTGDSYSCPFGATADTDDLIDSFLDVKSKVLAVTGFEVSRCSLQREKVGI